MGSLTGRGGSGPSRKVNKNDSRQGPRRDGTGSAGNRPAEPARPGKVEQKKKKRGE